MHEQIRRSIFVAGDAPAAPIDYNRNQQYSITAVSDGGGSVVERYAFSAYGRVTIADATGSVISNSAIANRYTYTGREWDEGLSLYHYRARMHDAVSGRFVSRDPIGYVDGSNLFRIYTRLTRLDPYGESVKGVIRNACRFVKKRGLCLGMIACLGAPGVTCLVACGGEPRWDDIDDDFADCMRKCLRNGIPEEFKLSCAGMVIACVGQKAYEFITTPGNITPPSGNWPQLELRPDRSLVR